MQSASTVRQDSRSWAANGGDNLANTKTAKPARSSDAKGSSGASANSGSGSTTVFQCSGFGDCRMVFTRSEHLARHVRKHTGERPFQCHCQKAFSRLDNLRQHCQTVHSDTPERNEEILRQLTVLHSNLAASAAKNQRTFARVVIPDGAKPESKAALDEKKGTVKESVKPIVASPGGSVAVSSLLSQPASTESGNHDDEGRDAILSKNGTPSKLLKPTTLPRLDTKSVPRSIQPTSFSPHSAPSSSAPVHSLNRPVFGAVASPTHAPLTSPSGMYGRGAAEGTSWNEPRSASALPPLSEISTRLRPSGLAPESRPYTSRSVSIVPDRPPFPLYDQQRRASIPLTGGPSSYPTGPHDLNYHAYYMPRSPRASYSPSFGNGRYSPTMSAEMRWSSPQAKRHSVGYASPTLASHPRPSLPLPKHALPGKKDGYSAPSSAYSTPADASVPPDTTAVDPLTPVRDSFGERPLKKSRSTYFGESGSTELASLTASGLSTHPMLQSVSTEATPPTHPPVTRYLPMRHRNLVPDFSLGSMGVPYTAEYDSLRHPTAPRRPVTGYVPSLSRDGKACARLDSARHTAAVPIPSGPASGLEYDEMTQKRSIEEDAR